MKKRKSYYVATLVLLWCVSSWAADPSLVITNQTPEVLVPESWIYESAPGTYFWNGFRLGAVVVAFCWGMSLVRIAFADDKEEM